MIVKDTEETIEFFIPSLGLEIEPYIVGGVKQGIHHLGRYHWAAKVLATSPPGRIIDVACGSGYGSFILAAALPDHLVVGGDYDPRAVERARETYQAPNLEYRRLDIVTWSDLESQEPIGETDYITSFDTIEHLLHREIALVSIAENLHPNGQLLLSTPIKQVNLLNPGWEHHKIEYGRDHFYNILQRFFADVATPEKGTLPGLDYWANVINAGEKRYLLRLNPLVCSKPIQLGLRGPKG